MDEAACRYAIGLLGVAIAALATAVAALWRAYRGAVKDLRKANDRHIRVLEAIKRHVQGG